MLPIHTHHFYPGELVLTVGEPIETAGMTVRQTDELTARLRAAVEGLLRQEDRQNECAVAPDAESRGSLGAIRE